MESINGMIYRRYKPWVYYIESLRPITQNRHKRKITCDIMPIKNTETSDDLSDDSHYLQNKAGTTVSASKPSVEW